MIVVRSSIDLGTNTCLLLVVRWDDKKREVIEVLCDESRIVRLGQGVDQSRKLHPDAKNRTLKALSEYASILQRFGASSRDTVAVATSQARDASDGALFFKDVEDQLGFRFRTISGEDEAKYTFSGSLLAQMNPAKTAVIDIGGGSTEFTIADPATGQTEGQSLDIGSVRFTERFLKSDPVTDQEFWMCQEAIDLEIQKLPASLRAQIVTRQLLGVAGTITTLASWFLEQKKFNAEEVSRVSLSRGDVHRMVEELKWRSVEERRAITGIEAQRADVLLAGAMILWRAMEILKIDICRVSPRGLRYGVLAMDLRS